MRAELYRPDSPDDVVAVATWADGRASIEVLDPSVGSLDALIRPTPMVVDDASLRQLGTHGEVLLEPGSFDWFRSALVTRGEAVGLHVRFVADEIVGGWDPAAAYRSFDEEVERLTS